MTRLPFWVKIDYMKELSKAYEPKTVEDSIYKAWEESGYFNPDNLPKTHKEPFSIVLPPPNVTGKLHVGHAVMLAIQDILIRYKRKQGFKTLWIPGMDHAAIATQNAVEKKLKKEEDKIGIGDMSQDETVLLDE